MRKNFSCTCPHKYHKSIQNIVGNVSCSNRIRNKIVTKNVRTLEN